MAIDEFLQYIRGFQEFLLMTLREDAFQCGEISNIYVRAVNLICRQTINQLVRVSGQAKLYNNMFVFCDFM